MAVITVVWEQLKLLTARLPAPPDCRTAELLYSSAVSEALIRIHGETMRRMNPTVTAILGSYASAGGDIGRDIMYAEMVDDADLLAAQFAEANGDPLVAVSPKRSARAQLIYILAMRLNPVARQKFQSCFVWDAQRRAAIFDDDELATWNAIELQVGMGILASIMHAKQARPDLTPEEFAAALLRKYGIPLVVDGVEVYACHWCGTGPCTCGGGKSPARRVTYDDARKQLHRGPMDTQHAMNYSYAWANSARAGEAYGPFRAIIEMVAEGGPVLADKTGSLADLESMFGPLLIPQQRHWAEVLNRIKVGKEERGKAMLSELADAVHWQWLNGPFVINHTAGLVAAIEVVADGVGALSAS